MNQFFAWYIGLLKNSDPKVVIATYAFTVALITFLLNFIFKPLLKFIKRRLELSKKDVVKNKEFKRLTYTQLSGLLHEFYENCDRLLLSRNRSFYKHWNSRLDENNKKMKGLSNILAATYSKKIQIWKDLKEEYEKTLETGNKYKDLLNLFSSEQNSIQPTELDSSQKDNFRKLEKLLSEFDEVRKSKEEQLKELSQELELANNNFNGLAQTTELYDQAINDEIEKNLENFDTKVDQLIYGLNHITDLKITSSEKVIKQINKVRNCGLAVKIRIDKILKAKEVNDDKVSVLLESNELVTIKVEMDELLSLMRKEIN